MIRIILSVILFVFPLTIFAQDSLLFVIRVDDIQSRNTTTLPRSIKPFQQAVEQRNGKITWAVIPHRLIETQNSDGALARELRESLLHGHEMAMHGYNHICFSCNQSSHEMFCTTYTLHFTYPQQIQLVEDGLKILRDSLNIVPQSFVPPGHQADTVTYQALVDRGFSWLSSTGGTKKFIYQNLYNLQQNNEYTWQLAASQYSAALVSALHDIRTAGSANGYYCLLLHDPFIRQGYESGLVVRWIGELLDSLNNHYGRRIRYATLGESAFIFRQQSVSGIAGNQWAPNTPVLFQNYPNPFNPTTVISYQLPVVSTVKLIVYDMLGRQVSELVNEKKDAGIHQVTFDARLHRGQGARLSSGVYFYRLQAGDASAGPSRGSGSRAESSDSGPPAESRSFILTRRLILMR